MGTLSEPEPRHLVMDEFALYKGHRYTTVVMDINTAFDLAVKAHCPKARVVYDLFHVVAKYGWEVIDRVCVDEANRLCDDRSARRVIKQSRWLLLRNTENLKNDGQRIHLGELLAANQDLATVYVMKAGLKETGWAWLRAWKDWLAQAKESGIESLAAIGLLAGHSELGALADAPRPAGRPQQPDQGDEANDLWLPGPPVLLPEDQSRLPGNP
nr:transposase [Vogesella sp. XCS3]